MAHEHPKDFILYDVSHEEVYLTGDWCDWKPNAIKMTKIPNLYFIATVLLPYNTKVAYKYIVNGTWMTNPEEQSETDAAGNTNNVFTTPTEAEATAHVAPTAAHQSSGLTTPLTGASSTSTSVPAAASSSSPKSGAAEEIQEAKTSGVPVGAAVAGSGIAVAAAGTAVAAGLGKSETDGVTGIEKVAPNVTQATSTSSASGLGSEKGLAKPDLGTSSTTTSSKAPLPASTADAPVAPGSATGEIEHKGLFSVIGGLAAGAAAAAAKTAYDLEHKFEGRFNESNTISSASSNVVGSEGPKSATQTPAVVPTSNEKSASNPTVPSNERINREIAAHPDPTAASSSPSAHPVMTTAHAGALGSGASSSLSGATSAAASHKENPASALDPIATNAGVSKITKEFAAVDFDHTKQEVVHAVERLGEVIAGGLSGIGAAHEGREIPAISDFWAKKGSAFATSAFGKSIHDPEPTSNNTTFTTTTTGENGVTPLGGLASFSSPAAAWPANTGVPSAGATSATSASKEGNTAAQAKDGSSGSAHTLPPVTGGPALYPSDNSAPAAIKIETPKTSTSQVQSESAKAGAHAPALDSSAMHPVTGSSTGNKGAATGATAAAATSAGTSSTAPVATTAAPAAAAASTTATGTSGHHDRKQPSLIDDLKKGIKGDNTSATHAPVATAGTGMLGPPAVADHESHGLTNNNKKEASTLGLASGATADTASSAGPPTTPKKAAAVGDSSTAATPATPKTDGFNTAPSTPSGTPADRKRKSSIFHKIKSALSPSK